ncbi:hypothetical protein B9L21_05320 [Geobacillus uzenensis]|uniref:Probable transposase IS891/IS1136/IS1341 domain-containing protein n=1 Tax=Geobacillus uzenensis TaxID=129339 RepID=A0ABX4DIM2_9BACL|nr:hypothetical protein B9L21_05320 [Geobacillus uzenensis]
MNRNNKVNDYINKTCRYIINYCIENQIGKLVIGYAETLQPREERFFSKRSEDGGKWLLELFFFVRASSS